jgi:Na+(H+)/acetate symporter ActP
MWSTVLWGLISLIGALSFTYVFDLVPWGYMAAGGAIFPFVVIGLLWRKRGAKDFTFKSSRVTPMAARWALIIGSIVSMVFHAIQAVKTAVGGGVIPGALVTAVLLVVISLATEKSEAAKPGATASPAAD